MELLLKLCEWAIQGVLSLAGLTVAVYTISVGFVARVRKTAEEEFARQLVDIERKLRSFSETLSRSAGIESVLSSVDELIKQKQTIGKARLEACNSWLPLSLDRAVLRPARLCWISLLALVVAYSIGSLGTGLRGPLYALICASVGLLLLVGIVIVTRAVIAYQEGR